jgi:UDP-2,3-diacylglucosamine pyrophosphatase LpxH
MQRLLRYLLYKPVLWIAQRFTSSPDRARVTTALTSLLASLTSGEQTKGPVLSFDIATAKFIIFSDQHKGAKDGADDFALAEPNYLAALKQYDDEGFYFVSLGDNEELWENSLGSVKKNNIPSFEAEKKFIARNAFTKIFGNHDLFWDNDPFASFQLKEIYGTDVPISEGILLKTKIDSVAYSIYCTHGHQGDSQSDGNWFSKFFISKIWAPLQDYLWINPNTPSTNDALKTVHNQMMYEWSAQQTDLLLITGHTHQPVFESMTHIESIYQKLSLAQKENKPEKIDALQAEIKLHGFAARNFKETKPTYFNSGCCCFDDGDITGIEISDGKIRLVKWDRKKQQDSQRFVLEESDLKELLLRTH